MSLVTGLRQLRHGPLRGLAPMWLRLGRLHRAALEWLPVAGATEQRIGPYGPFRMNPLYAFSDFSNWGQGANGRFRDCVEASRGKRCMLDVGAHIGLVTLPVSRVLASGGRVYAFEPAEANHRHLCEHLIMNEIDNVEVVQALVGAEESAAVPFFEQSEASGMNSVVVVKDHDAYLENTRRQITLDGFCAERDIAPEVIKIDIEGAELDVLAGSRETLRRCRPVIFLSIHPKHIEALGRSCAELAELIDSLGYLCEGRSGDPVADYRRDEYRLVPKERMEPNAR